MPRGRTAGPPTFSPPPDFDIELGNCRGANTDLFFPKERGWVPPEARELCDSCPVSNDCLSYALRHEPDGIWGGTSLMQRERIRRVIGYKRTG